MTRQRIADGLETLTLQLANRHPTHEPPADWTAHEWAYVCGIASGAIMRLRDDLARVSLDVVATTGGKATIETKR